MNNMLLFILVGLIAITSAALSENSQENQVKLLDMEIELDRKERDANKVVSGKKTNKKNQKYRKKDKKRKNRNKAKTRKNPKIKNSKVNKRGKNTNKKSNSKGKYKNRKNKRKNSMNKNKRKKNNLNKIKIKKIFKERKAKKSKNEKESKKIGDQRKLKPKQNKKENSENKQKETNRERKYSKSANTNNRIKPNNLRQSTSDSSSGSINSTCFTAAISHLKICKDRVTNFLKQEARMKNFNKTAGKKQSKKGLFAPIANKIIDVGGGNASNLSCGGTFGNSGAGNMTLILATLQGCETKVATACDPSVYPLPENMTKVTECSAMMKTYKTAVKKCIKKTGSEACSCWLDSNLTAMADVIKTCDISKENVKVTTQHKMCSGNFSACKGTEDSAGEYVFTCSQTAAELTVKAAQVKENKEALSSAKTTISQLAGNSSSNSTTNSTDRYDPLRRNTRSLTSCAAVIIASNQLLTLASQTVSSSSLATLAKQVANTINVSCTPAEQAALSGQLTTYTIVIVQATSVLSTFTSSVADSSGSAPTDAELNAALTNSTTNGTNNEGSSTTESGVTDNSSMTIETGGTQSTEGSKSNTETDTTVIVTTSAEETEQSGASTPRETNTVTEDGSTTNLGTTKVIGEEPVVIAGQISTIGPTNFEEPIIISDAISSVKPISSTVSTGSEEPIIVSEPISSMKPISSTGSIGSEEPMTSIDMSLSSTEPISSKESSKSMGSINSLGSTSSMGVTNSMGSTNSLSSKMSSTGQVTTSRPGRKFAIRNLAKSHK